MTTRRKIAAGNWKMNGLRQALAEVEALHGANPAPGCEVIICPPATLLRSMAKTCAEAAINVGGQDCHQNSAGAHTGDISAEMIADTGATHVIVGHSERRETYGETDALVRAKTNAAWGAGLVAIVCIGETLDQRESAATLDIVGGQLAGSIPDGATSENLVVAYEPVWAIGTGKIPTYGEIEEVHDFIRARLVRRFGATTGNGVRVLYGGSMKPDNAAEIGALSNVDGGLVGGASLKAADFSRIVAGLS
jgi:triosephosphate isomerase